MKKSSSLIALAGVLALLGGQAVAETKQPAAAKTVKTAVKKSTGRRLRRGQMRRVGGQEICR